MAKISSSRRLTLDDPEDVLNLVQRWLAPLKRQWKWILMAVILLAAALGTWGISARMQAAREERAAEALSQVQPKLAGAEAGTQGLQALEQFIKESAGTRAGREAEQLRANLLYQGQKYAEAAKAYSALPKGRDPGWDALIAESLSYCYEGMGDFKKAAQVLQPVVEQTSGPWGSEMMQHLALLYDRAQEPREAARFWRKLLEAPPDPSLTPYFKEKLAASEAKIKP